MDEPRRPPALFMPYPLDEYLDALPGDYGKVARKLLRAARWTRGRVGGIELDAGESLIDERSEALWGGLALDRDVKGAGRRALVRRVLERLERDGIVTRRAAHARGPGSSPRNGPRNGPSPTVVRFMKFRGILWPAGADSAQETAQGPAQETAQRFGPVLPEETPDPPEQQTLAVPAGAAPAPPPVMRLPCVGSGPKEFEVSEDQVAKWVIDFPHVDVLEQLRKTRPWLEANPSRRPTHRGMLRFLVSWLSRAQDSSRRAPARQTTGSAPQPLADLGWLDQVPPERQPEAREAWRQASIAIERAAYPDAKPRMLAEAAASLRQEFLS